MCLCGRVHGCNMVVVLVCVCKQLSYSFIYILFILYRLLFQVASIYRFSVK